MEKTPIQELDFLGKKVQVKIDRALGSHHPKYHFEYLLNYGFVPETIGGDGKEIDVYVIGVQKPIKEFYGVVKGVIIRFDDNENKLVVVHSEYDLTVNEIREKTYFQEKHFNIKIVLLEKNK